MYGMDNYKIFRSFFMLFDVAELLPFSSNVAACCSYYDETDTLMSSSVLCQPSVPGRLGVVLEGNARRLGSQDAGIQLMYWTSVLFLVDLSRKRELFLFHFGV